VTQKRGIIKLIPKDAEPFLIRNWRPITIIATVRLRPKLLLIASRKNYQSWLEQTGFMKGQFRQLDIILD